MLFSIAFYLVSKLRSCPVTATEKAGAGFRLIISDAEEIAVVVTVEGEIRVERVLLLTVVIGTVT